MADKNPTVTIEMEQGGEIVIELDPSNAPNTVKNFIALANSGFYDGLTFHRVIPGFMIQGGCPEGFGTGDPGYRIRGEFKANGHDNKLKHKRGVISMARAQPNDSAGCQFFIMDKASSHLDGQYAAFGQVEKGLDIVDRIVAVATDPNDKPLEKQTIKRITVETYGVEYELPEKL
jgi:peptidyl-prolyl cis-trans isomerase B (cyclophilin B)